MKERNSTLDIIRIVAFLCVVAVHFFLNSGFYEQVMEGKTMYVLTLFRTLFMICVPLFMILSGYLCRNKKLSSKYYLGIIHILIILVLSFLVCSVYATFFAQGRDFSLASLRDIKIQFPPYGWYMEMYIGMFLIIPFLNIIYNGLDTKKKKLVLIASFAILTVLPSIFNSIIPGNGRDVKLIPDWWQGIYPITYYFIGCYLGEYKPKMNPWLNILLLILSVTVFGSFCFIKSHGGNFGYGIWHDWGSAQNTINSVLVFILLSGFNTKNIKLPIKKMLKSTADITLGAYLVSSVFDMSFYPVLVEAVPNMTDRVKYFPLMFIMVAVCSLIVSKFMQIINDFIMGHINRAIEKREQMQNA